MVENRVSKREKAAYGVVVVGLVCLGGLWWFHGSRTVESERMVMFGGSGRLRPPFRRVRSPFKATKAWGSLEGPRPTGAWWTNLVLEGHFAAICVPYAVRVAETGGIEFGYGASRRSVSATAVVDPFVADVRIGLMADFDSAYDATLESADALTATIQFTPAASNDDKKKKKKKQWTSSSSFFRGVFARGSPYVTIEVSEDALPLAVTWPGSLARFEAKGAKEKKKEDPEEAACSSRPACAGLYGDCCPTTGGDFLDCCSALSSESVEGPIFEIVGADGRLWRLYASTTVAVEKKEGPGTMLSVSAKNPTTKKNLVLRIAYAVDDSTVDLLDSHFSTYATAGKVAYAAKSVNATTLIDYYFDWTTASSQDKKGKLLMLALPHHAASFLDEDLKLKTFVGKWKSMKGPLVPVLGSTWPHMRVNHPDHGVHSDFFAKLPPRDAMTIDLLARSDVENLGGGGTYSSSLSKSNQASELAFARATGVYGCGKRATRFASLAIAAKAAGNDDAARSAAKAAAAAVSPWLDPSTNLLLFDKTYGGICTSKGLSDDFADFGNGKYNDHHFHYGYHLYAAAVAMQILGKDEAYEALLGPSSYDSDLAAKRRVHASLASLLADIATPFEHISDDDDDDKDNKDFAAEFTADSSSSRRRIRHWRFFGSNNDKKKSTPHFLFPTARHKDFYDGHSWASGLFPLADGKSQESVSEAAHCYYAVALLGRVLQEPELQTWGEFLLGLEVQAARTYWHVVDDALYPHTYASSNSIVAVVGASDLHAATWFGKNPALAHLVSAIPFTPMSESLLVAPYVRIAEHDVGRSLSEPETLLVDDDNHTSGNKDSFTDDEHLDLDTWRSLYLQLLAVVDQEKARHEVQKMSFERTTPPLDTTQSLAAMLYWINTRPRPAPDLPLGLPAYLSSNQDMTQPLGGQQTNNNASRAPESAACDDHPNCKNLAITGDCCPAPGNVFLWCCD